MTDSMEIEAAREHPHGKRHEPSGDTGGRLNASQAPSAPGCYIMLDGKGRTIYVGKAKNLRARIRNYLNESDSRYSVKFLLRRVERVDYLVTATEKEALLLENSLIKQHRPRYNVRLKDDKTYLSLRLDPREPFPRITVVRRHRKDGARYFGPYHNALAVRQTLRQIQRFFPLRTCSDQVMRNRLRPCLYYQMGRCVAPCVGYANRETYHEIVDQVTLILEGRSRELEQALLDGIRKRAERLEFEAAGALRDRLYDMRRMLERQSIVAVPGVEDRDVFGLFTEGRFTEIQVLFYRGRKMVGGRCFSFEYNEMPQDELLSSFLLQYYASGAIIPREILVPLEFEDQHALAELLSEKRGTKVEVIHPLRGEKKALLELAHRNARHSFEEKRLSRKANVDILEQLKQLLRLPVLPERIECFDISTIQGNITVAAMAVFRNGVPDKTRYRRFAVRAVAGQDDFASLREVMLRRYTRGIQENDLPELVLIDGGRGQLNVATAVFQDLGIEDLPHAAIAKARRPDHGGPPDRLFVPGRANPIIPRQSHPVTQLLARIRDEAHRFAITYHRQRRAKTVLSTVLSNIPGVGPKRARTLLNKIGSVARIATAPVEEIAALPGFSPRLAQRIRDHLSGAPPDPEK